MTLWIIVGLAALALLGQGFSGWALALSLVPIAAVVYLVQCWIWPFGKCGGEWWKFRACDGGRVYQNAKKKTFRECGKCRSTGKQKRFGRKVWTWWKEAGRKAQIK